MNGNYRDVTEEFTRAAEAISLGESINIFRTSNGISKKELAKRLGVTTQYIAQVEADAVLLDAQFIPTIADFLDMPEGIIIRRMRG